MLLGSRYLSAFKDTVKMTIEKLIKKNGIERVKEATPDGSLAFLMHTYKMMKREKREELLKNLEGAIATEMKEIKHLKPWMVKESMDDLRAIRDID